MRTLEQALQEHELIVLRVIGEWMELDLTGEDKAAAVEALAAALAQVDLVEEMKHLDPEEVAALNDLAANGGRIPVATFARTHGEVRQMGPGAMAREEPWLDPASPAESLWYRGFLYRGFDETDEGLIEFFYLPRELAQQLPTAAKTKSKAVGSKSGSKLGSKSVGGKAIGGKTAVNEPGEPKENKAPLLIPIPAPAEYQAAVSDAVDDLATLLAISQRTGLSPRRGKRSAVIYTTPAPTGVHCCSRWRTIWDWCGRRRWGFGRPARPWIGSSKGANNNSAHCLKRGATAAGTSYATPLDLLLRAKAGRTTRCWPALRCWKCCPVTANGI